MIISGHQSEMDTLRSQMTSTAVELKWANGKIESLEAKIASDAAMIAGLEQDLGIEREKHSEDVVRVCVASIFILLIRSHDMS